MSIAVGLLLGFCVVALILSALVHALNETFKAAGSVRQGILDRIGRKSLGRKAKIAAELLVNAKPFPTNDTELLRLQTYRPTVSVEHAVHASYESGHDFLFSSLRVAAIRADISEVPSLLVCSQQPPYLSYFNLLKERIRYPVPEPARPSIPPSPPTWSPWSLEAEEPHIDVPYYVGWRSIFNGIVTRVHEKEEHSVRDAAKRRAELLQELVARNALAKQEAQRAAQRHGAAIAAGDKAWNKEIGDHERNAAQYRAAMQADAQRVQQLQELCDSPGRKGLVSRIDLAMRTMAIAPWVSRESQTEFDDATGVLVHDHRFPDLSSIHWFKMVEQRRRSQPANVLEEKPATQREVKEVARVVYPALCLRLAAEISRLDREDLVKGIAVNGWVDYTDKATGQRKRAFCATFFGTRQQVDDLNLREVDPVLAFGKLKGQASPPTEMTPLMPIVRLDTNDPRFVEAREVLSRMVAGENLATMDWEDFEHLCRELFERAFASVGAEVKVTQASRDQGVDAVVFDPDPLRGGKIIIQAKRYTNTVDVSAVRDLYGAVVSEGATKGILVTTSQYGPDSYAFAKDKPLSLLNGRELLGLLEKHGYKFRIDLAEAKALASGA
jgi:restriction system protein